MKDYQNVREALEDLVQILDPDTNWEKKTTVKDIQKMSIDPLAYVCEVLGMGDIYLGDKIPSVNGHKPDAKKIAAMVQKQLEKSFEQSSKEFGSSIY